MRTDVNIIWLDDKHNSTIKHLQRKIEKSIAEKGYLAKIYMSKSLNEALELMKHNNRIDLFVSDYNLGTHANSLAKTGLDFLQLIRNDKCNKQFFLLYSANGQEIIKKNVISFINQNQIDLIMNLSFISIQSINLVDDVLSTTIDIALSKWDELSALRGSVLSANADFESFLYSLFKDEIVQSIHSSGVYHDLINLFGSSIIANSVLDQNELFDILKMWHNQRKLRNDLAHVCESYDIERQSHFIKSVKQSSLVIYEKDINRHRAQIYYEIREIYNIIERVNTRISS